MGDAPLNLDRILRVLAKHDVRYLLVGGVAAQRHGATRATMDVDCVPDDDRMNLRRLAAAMRELHARLRTDGYIDAETRESTAALVHEDFFANVEITTWETDAGALDILRNIPDATGRRLGYAHLAQRSIVQDYDGISIRIASLDDIVASKQWASRPKDHEALAELHELQNPERKDRQ